MTLVVLVHQYRDEAERYAAWLGGEGYTLHLCGGPLAPAFQCVFQSTGRCPLWENGELFIYTPWLDLGTDGPNSEELVLALRSHYPDKPLILTGPGQVVPTWVKSLAARDRLVAPAFPADRQTLRVAARRSLALAEEAAQARLAVPGDPADHAQGGHTQW